MLGMHISRTKFREEGEKPFWISYSDLMTALMVLFLVVMSVSILTITQELLEKQDRLIAQQKDLERKNAELALAKRMMDEFKQVREKRQKAIDSVMKQLEAAAAEERFKGQITIFRDQLTLGFGDAARFQRGDYHLTNDGSVLLRSFTPAILTAADSPEGRQWFRRVVVEGFTDTDGSYLYNLNLSLKRAQSVVCALMAPPTNGSALTIEQQRRVSELFLVGGFSFNSKRASMEESRRVEWRLEFRPVKDLDQTAIDQKDPGIIGPEMSAPMDMGKCQMN